MSPFRALVAAHAASSFNRTKKQLGAAGAWGVIAFALLLGGSVFVPFGLLFALGGYGLTRTFSTPEATTTIAGTALFYSFMTLILGVWAGISSGSKQLSWETLKVFPVRPLTLFRTELFAAAFEATTIIELGTLGAGCAGAVVGAPRASLYFVTLWATHGVVLLALQQIFGSVAQRLSKHFRALIVLLPVVAVLSSLALPLLIERAKGVSFQGWHERLDQLTTWLPARLLLEAARDDAVGPNAIIGIASSVLLAVLTISLSFALVATEREASSTHQAVTPAKQWSFTTPLLGIARLQWEALIKSIAGKGAFALPLVAILLLRGPLAQVLPSRGWTAPVAFGYAALAATNLMFNQFGLDRHGVKVLMLLPLSSETLLRGKLLGFSFWLALQALFLAVLLLLTGYRDTVELVAGLLVYACFGLSFAILGPFVSVWQPRPIKSNGLRAAQPSLAVSLIMLAVISIAGGVFYGVLYATHFFWPGWEVPALLAVVGVLASLLMPSLTFNARFLDDHRERLVETLASAG